MKGDIFGESMPETRPEAEQPELQYVYSKMFSESYSRSSPVNLLCTVTWMEGCAANAQRNRTSNELGLSYWATRPPASLGLRGSETRGEIPGSRPQV